VGFLNRTDGRGAEPAAGGAWLSTANNRRTAQMRNAVQPGAISSIPGNIRSQRVVLCCIESDGPLGTAGCFLSAAVRGPVDFFASSRFALIWAAVGVGGWSVCFMCLSPVT